MKLLLKTFKTKTNLQAVSQIYRAGHAIIYCYYGDKYQFIKNYVSWKNKQKPSLCKSSLNIQYFRAVSVWHHKMVFMDYNQTAISIQCLQKYNNKKFDYLYGLYLFLFHTFRLSRDKYYKRCCQNTLLQK